MKRFWLNLGQKLKNYAFERHRDVINDVIVCLIIVFVIHQKYRVVVLESCHLIGLYQDQILNNNLSVFTSKIFFKGMVPSKNNTTNIFLKKVPVVCLRRLKLIQLCLKSFVVTLAWLTTDIWLISYES